MRIHYWELSNYNAGNLIGQWFELNGLTYSEHMEELKEWLADLTEKTGALCEEWIVGDSEGIPDKYVGTYSIDADFFDYLQALESSGLDAEIFDAGIYVGINPENIADYYYGTFESDRLFAEEYLENYGDLASVPDHLQGYIDYEAYARDLLINCFSEYNGHYFCIG